MGGRGTTSKERYKLQQLTARTNLAVVAAPTPTPPSPTVAPPDSDIPGPEEVPDILFDSRYEARAFNDAQEAIQMRNWNPTEQRALEDYTYKGDRDMNGILRRNEFLGNLYPNRAAAERAISNIDGAMAKSKLTKSIQVWRGGTGDMSEGLEVGDVMTDKGFGSTSLLRSISADFAHTGSYHHKGSNPINKTMMKIYVPKGARATHVANLTSHYSSELELVIHRNAKYRIDKIVENSATQTSRDFSYSDF